MLESALYVLIAITPSGDEYVWRKNLTQYGCHVAYITERNAVIDLLETRRDEKFNLKFECRQQ